MLIHCLHILWQLGAMPRTKILPSLGCLDHRLWNNLLDHQKSEYYLFHSIKCLGDCNVNKFKHLCTNSVITFPRVENTIPRSKNHKISDISYAVIRAAEKSKGSHRTPRNGELLKNPNKWVSTTKISSDDLSVMMIVKMMMNVRRKKTKL